MPILFTLGVYLFFQGKHESAKPQHAHSLHDGRSNACNIFLGYIDWTPQRLDVYPMTLILDFC
jgi:hypothetical protein